MHERRRIDAHERDERPKVQQLRALARKNQEETSQVSASRADRRSRCFAGICSLRVDLPEKAFWKSIAPAHAVEQPRRSQLCAHSRADIRDQNREVQQLEQEEAPGLPSLPAEMPTPPDFRGNGLEPQTSCAA